MVIPRNRWVQEKQGEDSEMKIKKALHDNGEMSQKRLELMSGLSHETIRKKLKKMKQRDEVSIHKVGRENMVRLSDESLIKYEKANWPIIDEIISLKNKEGSYLRVDRGLGFSEDIIFDGQAPLDNIFSSMPPDAEFYRWFLAWVAADQLSNQNVENPKRGGFYIHSFSVDFASVHRDIRELQYILKNEVKNFFKDPQLRLRNCETSQELRSTILHYLDLFNVAYRIKLSERFFSPVGIERQNAYTINSDDLGKRMDRFIGEILAHGEKLISDLDRNAVKKVIAMTEHGENPFLDRKLSSFFGESKKYRNYGLVDNLSNEYITAAMLLKIRDSNFTLKLNNFHKEARNHRFQEQELS